MEVDADKITYQPLIEVDNRGERRGGLGRDHLCSAHVAGQVGAAAHRPLG
jgi:hypothetical protein